MKIISPGSEGLEGGLRRRGVSGVISVDQSSIKKLLNKFISGKYWIQIIRKYCETIRAIREDQNIKFASKQKRNLAKNDGGGGGNESNASKHKNQQ